MPEPTDPLVDWASDPNFPAGADPWSGQPSKVQPSAGQEAEGLVPDTKPAAEWLNWLLNHFTTWLAYLASFIDGVNDEYIYPVVKTRALFIPAEAFHSQGSWQANTGNGNYLASPDGSVAVMDLSKYLPSGCTITALAVYVRHDTSAVATASERIAAWFYRRTFDLFGGTIVIDEPSGAFQFAGSAGTAVQSINFPSGLPLLLSKDTETLSLKVRSQTSGVASAIEGVLVTFTDPGPRNF